LIIERAISVLVIERTEIRPKSDVKLY